MNHSEHNENSLFFAGIFFYRETGETVVVSCEEQVDILSLDDDEKAQAYSYFKLLKSKDISQGCYTWHNGKGVKCKQGNCTNVCVLRRAKKGDEDFEDIPKDDEHWYEKDGEKWYKKQPGFAYTCECK